MGNNGINLATLLKMAESELGQDGNSYISAEISTSISQSISQSVSRWSEAKEGALAFPELSRVAFSDRGELSKVSALLTFLGSDSDFDRGKSGQQNPLKILKNADVAVDALYTL